MRNSPTPEIPLRRSPAPAPRQLSALALAAGFALAAPHARVQAQTVLPEVQITTAAVPDFEFDSARRGRFCASCNFGSGNARLSFTDSSGNLWLGGVDYATGDFIPANGRGQLLDTATPPVPCFGNGPEWMASTAGSQIVYTRFVDGSGFPGDGTYSCTASPPQLAVATQTASGWTTAVLPNSLNRATPEGSTDETDSDPRINYIENGKTALFWRRLSAPTVNADPDQRPHRRQLTSLGAGHAADRLPGPPRERPAPARPGVAGRHRHRRAQGKLMALATDKRLQPDNVSLLSNTIDWLSNELIIRAANKRGYIKTY